MGASSEGALALQHHKHCIKNCVVNHADTERLSPRYLVRPGVHLTSIQLAKSSLINMARISSSTTVHIHDLIAVALSDHNVLPALQMHLKMCCYHINVDDAKEHK